MVDALWQTLQGNLDVDSDKEEGDEGTINPPADAKPFDMESEYSMIQDQQGSLDNGDDRRIRKLQN